MPARFLTDEQVREIRHRYHDDSAFSRELAGEFGVTTETIRRIVNGWKRVAAGGPMGQRKGMRGRNPRCRKLTDADVLEIYRRGGTAESLQDIADAFGVTRSMVNKITRGKKYADVTGGAPIQRRFKVTWQLREAMADDWRRTGATVRELAERHGVSRGTAAEILAPVRQKAAEQAAFDAARAAYDAFGSNS